MTDSADTYNAILKTICYADIFDYPLTEAEVFRWCMRRRDDKLLSNIDIKRANGVIAHRNELMYLRGREVLIKVRSKRETISEFKLAIASRVAAILKLIPTIKLIGISGSVTMNNASEKDDIDFFIVAGAHTIWITRLLSTAAVEIFSKRRRPGDLGVRDKICLNMFVDERFMAIPKKRRNLYTAHEVCQLRVQYDRDNTYSKFLVANLWVKEYLPNAVSSIKYPVLSMKKKNTLDILHNTLYILEWCAKKLQLWYMSKHRTTEKITDRYLYFHPKDYTHNVLAAFDEKVRRYAAKI